MIQITLSGRFRVTVPDRRDARRHRIGMGLPARRKQHSLANPARRSAGQGTGGNRSLAGL